MSQGDQHFQEIFWVVGISGSWGFQGRGDFRIVVKDMVKDMVIGLDVHFVSVKEFFCFGESIVKGTGGRTSNMDQQNKSKQIFIIHHIMSNCEFSASRIFGVPNHDRENRDRKIAKSSV
jgi:hypothetical protein